MVGYIDKFGHVVDSLENRIVEQVADLFRDKLATCPTMPPIFILVAVPQELSHSYDKIVHPKYTLTGGLCQ